MVLLKKQNETVNPSLHQLSLVPRGREGCKPKNGVDKLLVGKMLACAQIQKAHQNRRKPFKPYGTDCLFPETFNRIRRDNWIKKQRICLLVIISLIHDIRFSQKCRNIFWKKFRCWSYLGLKELTHSHLSRELDPRPLYRLWRHHF